MTEFRFVQSGIWGRLIRKVRPAKADRFRSRAAGGKQMSNRREKIRIEVDDRESAGAVLPGLRECADFHVSVMRLPIGDYRVDGRYLFERKTTDLVAAIKDGRLFKQALRLAATPLRPAIILEGTSREIAGSGMKWEAIQGPLETVAGDTLADAGH